MPFQESKYNPEYCEIATKVLADGESLAAVAAEIGICRATLYNWRDTHPEFSLALRIGLQKAQRDWEKLGKQGIKGELDKFSAPAWIFTMKNRFRDDYAEDKSEQDNHAIVEELQALRADLDAKNKKEY